MRLDKCSNDKLKWNTIRYGTDIERERESKRNKKIKSKRNEIIRSRQDKLFEDKVWVEISLKTEYI